MTNEACIWWADPGQPPPRRCVQVGTGAAARTPLCCSYKTTAHDLKERDRGGPKAVGRAVSAAS
jgi:hypothetical protein